MYTIGVYDGNKARCIAPLLKELFNLGGIPLTFYSSDETPLLLKKPQEIGVNVLVLDGELDNEKSLSLDVLLITSQEGLLANRLFHPTPGHTILIINGDERGILKHLRGYCANLITCGFNPKASVTASSVQESQSEKVVQYCIQRSFAALNHADIEPQEFPLNLEHTNSDIITQLCIITTALVSGVDCSLFYSPV